jgi:hypothetical protein
MFARSVLGSVLLGAVCGGCSTAAVEPARRMTDAEKKAFREAWGESAQIGAVPHPQSIQVASGPAPLVYMTNESQNIWIADDKGRQWGPAPAVARAIVRVSADTGIAVGTLRLERGPLPEGRTYTITIGAPPERGWMNRTVGGDAAKPQR